MLRTIAVSFQTSHFRINSRIYSYLRSIVLVEFKLVTLLDTSLVCMPICIFAAILNMSSLLMLSCTLTSHNSSSASTLFLKKIKLAQCASNASKVKSFTYFLVYDSIITSTPKYIWSGNLTNEEKKLNTVDMLCRIKLCLVGARSRTQYSALCPVAEKTA